MSDTILGPLNDQQREAVTAADGALLVLAGAGSGKTRVIVHRMAYLVDERGVSPKTILAVTFTNKAAEEMRARVEELLPETGKGIAVHTFHALCLRLLRSFGEDIGLPESFTVYGNDDRKQLLRRICKDLAFEQREFPLSRIASAVSSFKLRTFMPRAGFDSRFEDIISNVVSRYQDELSAQGAVDFDDLLLKGVEILECSERTQDFVAKRFCHVLIDEYQDTNRVQYRLMRLIAPHKNVFVVGDDDQSIYNFRGADMRNILDFEADFPLAKTIKLEINYRSSGAILRAAEAVIQNNATRKGKRLVASQSAGEPPEIYCADDERDEARYVSLSLKKLRSAHPGATAAVLLRTHAQTRVFEEELVEKGIPHRVLGGLRFYDRKEIRDTLAYARLLLNRCDNASFLRVVNVPLRGVGRASVAMIESCAKQEQCSLWDAAQQALNNNLLPGRATAGLKQFLELVGRLDKQTQGQQPSLVLSNVIDESGIVPELLREGDTARERRENLEQLVAAAAEYEAQSTANLAGFLDSISLVTDIDAAVAAPFLLMTLHAAKGLEFDSVFLAGLEEGLFPHIRATGNPKSIEEERRLFYVGMTRAKRRLYLSYAQSRRISFQTNERSPSRFLSEVPGANLEDKVRPAHHAVQSSKKSILKPGVFVQHSKFGTGKIVDASGVGPDRRVTVLFPTAGRKRLVVKFANLQVVN